MAIAQVLVKIPLDPSPSGPSAETLWANPGKEPGTYCLDNAPLFTGDYAYGDLVRAESQPDGWLVVTALVEPSSWRHFLLRFPNDALETEIERVLQQTRAQSGPSWGHSFWEGGLGRLMLEVPAGVDAEPLLKCLQRMCRQRWKTSLLVFEGRTVGSGSRRGVA